MGTHEGGSSYTAPQPNDVELVNQLDAAAITQAAESLNFGVHIEAYGIRAANLISHLRQAGELRLSRLNGWSVRDDPTIPPPAGMEGCGVRVVSGLLNGARGRGDLAAVLAAMNALPLVTTHQAAGLHVTVDISMWRIDDVAALYRLFATLEPTFDLAMPPWRRSTASPKMRPVRSVPVVQRILAGQDDYRLPQEWADLMRFEHTLNLCPVQCHCLMEFSQHEAVISAEPAAAWILTCLHMVALAQRRLMPPQDAQPAQQLLWLAGNDQQLREYWLHRLNVYAHM